MVRRILSFISKEIGGLHEAAYLLGAFALVSQVLALVRDHLLAYTFGASHDLDIYYAAFRIPDFIFVSIASLVSLSVLIPFLMEKINSSEEEAKKFIDAIFTFFFFVIGIVAVIAFILTPWLIKLFFPALDADHENLIVLTRIMLLSPIFLGFSNFLASITHIYKRFFIYALSPVFYNVGIIFGIVVLYPVIGLKGLAWGVAIGAFLHFFIQVPFVWHKSLFPKFSFPLKFALIKQPILVSLPRTLTLSSNEIAEFFLVVLASTLAGGAISVFNFSWNLQSVPLSIIGISYSLAAFPLLTKLFTTGEKEKFLEQMIISSKHILFWSIPIMMLFVVLRAQIVRVILGSGAGNFDWSDTRLTAANLAIFTLSLIPQSLGLLFVRSYYARGDTKKPLVINFITSGLVILSSYLLVLWFNTNEFFRYFIETLFRVDDLPGAVILMLPLGFSLGLTINMLVHWIVFERSFKGFSKPVLYSFYQILSAAIIMGFVAHQFLEVFDNVFDINTFLGIFMQGLLSGIIGIIAGITILVLLRNKELKVISETLHKKIWRVKVVAPDASDARG